MENMDEEKTKSSKRKNNLNTRGIPPITMLSAGLIAFIIDWIKGYDFTTALLVIFITMLVFAIVGTVVKAIVDNFDMRIDYEDLLAEDGDVFEKNGD